MDKEYVIHIDGIYLYQTNEILVSNKKNYEILPLATTQMDLEGIML